jgi:hypothetical protein
MRRVLGQDSAVEAGESIILSRLSWPRVKSQPDRPQKTMACPTFASVHLPETCRILSLATR